ncbi:MHYT domain-containing protein [Nocardiopsis sp. NPDC007018]|uniref:MHYT domain-containing protein n=1 Tax=Nocardiopsis sp. NPDC007018 TaxID=3155721 RepID=UPI00340419EE
MTELLPQGWPTPTIAFAISVIGAFLGFSFAARARRTTGFFRWQWHALAALALGGMAVWAMHFVAMLGYSVPGTPLRYDVPLTVLSGAVPVLVTGVALLPLQRGATAVRVLGGGLLVGLGIVAMHHVGVAAMNLHGTLHHDPYLMAVSTVIAVVAGTAALWCARRTRGLPGTVLASVVLAAAVTATHYTSMAGMRIVPPDFTPVGAPDGAKAWDLLLPVITGLFVLLLICSLFLLLGDDEENERRDYSRAAERAPDRAEPGTGEAYTPRHGVPVAPRPTDDVWTRRR